VNSSQKRGFSKGYVPVIFSRALGRPGKTAVFSSQEGLKQKDRSLPVFIQYYELPKES